MEEMTRNLIMLLSRRSCSLGIIGVITGGIIQTSCSKGAKMDTMAAKPESQKPLVLVFRRRTKKMIIIL